MPDNLLDQARVDRRAFAVTSFAEEELGNRACWRSRTPDERLEPLELCRQIVGAPAWLPAEAFATHWSCPVAVLPPPRHCRLVKDRAVHVAP
jgi:hypothetical protein